MALNILSNIHVGIENKGTAPVIYLDLFVFQNKFLLMI